MRLAILLLAATLCFGLITVSADAQHPLHKSVKVDRKAHKPLVKRHPVKPKNEVTKVRTARKKHHTVRQVTVDPKKSPGKHADNLSKNANHEINRESKDINHLFQGKSKPKKKK